MGLGTKYTGKAPCPGCGRTGEERARDSKDCLCRECQTELEIGRALCKERGLERKDYKLEELCGARVKYHLLYEDGFNDKLIKLLKTFSAFDVNRVAEWRQEGLIKTSEGGSDKTFALPVCTYEAAKDFAECVQQISREIADNRKNYREEIKKQAEAELAEQKNAIYNEGIAHGRNLLLQLNNNEITADEFTRPVKRF